MADGIGCTCNAHGAHECGCDADWTSSELTEARMRLAKIEGYLEALCCDARLLAQLARSLPRESLSLCEVEAANRVMAFTDKRCMRCQCEMEPRKNCRVCYQCEAILEAEKERANGATSTKPC